MTAPRPPFAELLEPRRPDVQAVYRRRLTECHAARRPLSERGWFQYAIVTSLTALALALAIVAMLLMRELAS